MERTKVWIGYLLLYVLVYFCNVQQLVLSAMYNSWSFLQCTTVGPTVEVVITKFLSICLPGVFFTEVCRSNSKDVLLATDLFFIEKQTERVSREVIFPKWQIGDVVS